VDEEEAVCRTNTYELQLKGQTHVKCVPFLAYAVCACVCVCVCMSLSLCVYMCAYVCVCAYVVIGDWVTTKPPQCGI
jgi:hypothetical protein